MEPNPLEASHGRQPSRKKRRYAGYFDWHIKPRKELGILEDLIKSMEAEGRPRYHSPRIQDEDPPNCTALDTEGRLVAVEVAELVSEDAVRRTQQGQTVLADWPPDHVTAALEALLRDKDRKSFRGGPYSKRLVVIHTDEYSITYEEIEQYLRDRTFGPFHIIDEAYLLLSYNPYYRKCPFIELRVDPIARPRPGSQPSP